MVANDRGQLLLIGGIAVAIVVFSTILFAHSLAVTDGITTTGSADTIERSADREASVERDLRRLATETRGDDLDGFEERYGHALRNYTRTHNRVVGSREGTYLNATLNESASLGTTVNQTDTPAEKFKKPGGGGGNKWSLVNESTRIAVFNVTYVNLDGGGNPTTIVVENETDRWTMTLAGTPPGPNKEILVNGVTRCSGSANIDADLLAGTCETPGTSQTYPTFLDELEGPYNITIKHGPQSRVTYLFAAVGDFSDIDSSEKTSYPVVPAVDTTYDTPSASYNRTVLVEVGDG
ncbi:hypothetical protein Har1130_05960 [Haloarcula sp. CBA1130]|uniref:hypothetical protein n=1 Tax=unclassified Haloarcula TaxID=2624677 RepID=UPI0012479970|nr:MULTISPECIES: hypothetical protein [unclassified Haloarcula]KAA9398006.1 hypothetical protein Har1129_07180 [Haloarcula sp. CBA1129]KAA9402306.1 hypothetical protein Har1130_05960 [Haloarcula sp. CBA1130]